MKIVGIVRKLKDNGRLVIPKELREEYGMDDDASVEIFAGAVWRRKMDAERTN